MPRKILVVSSDVVNGLDGEGPFEIRSDIHLKDGV